MEGIRLHVTKWSKRNALSRSLRAKDNEKVIAAWKLDLDGIHRALQVRHFPCELRLLLTLSFQAELAAKADADVRNISNTHANPPGLHHGIPNIDTPDVHSDVQNLHDVVSRTHRDVGYSHPIVYQAWEDTASRILPGAHRNMLRNLGDADDQNRTVSNTCRLLFLSINSRCIVT
jgi:hypothetical protein